MKEVTPAASVPGAVVSPGVLYAGPSDKALNAVMQDRRRRDEGTKGMSGT